MVNDLRLTPREREVLLLVATGATYPTIGRQLGIARSTVKDHIERVMNKLGASDRRHAVMLALEAGIIRRDELV